MTYYIGLKISRFPEFRGYRMYSIFIKNHLCSKRRSMHLDHEQFYNNVVGSFVKAVMVEEILLIQCRQFFCLTELRCELICRYS